jgi:hypothetical protein
MADDGGVLGNLPRSRPGQRSDKRDGRTAAKATAGAERADAKATAPPKLARATGAKRSGAAAAGAKRAAGGTTSRSERTTRQAPPEPPASQAGDPVGDAIRTVTGVAATGARVAGGVAREVLRRLPRP